MSTNSPTLSQEQLKEIAAQWIVRRLSGLSPAEESELQTWLKADSRHTDAFATLEASWDFINAPRREGRGERIDGEIHLHLVRRARTRRMALFSTGLAAALLIGFFVLQPAKVAPANLPTVAVRPDRQKLPDGSIVELNAGAEIAVDYTADTRGVRLLKGEALFQVSRDPVHPFVVTAGNIHVRAIGTAFTVHYQTEKVGVLVTEGRVAVEKTNPPSPIQATAPEKSEPLLLGAGGRVEVPTNAPLASALVQIVSTAAVAEAITWREKRLEFSDTPLPVAVELFNQANHLQIAVGDNALKHRVITGIFWSNDPDTFVRLLEEGLSLKAERRGNAITLRDATAR